MILLSAEPEVEFVSTQFSFFHILFLLAIVAIGAYILFQRKPLLLASIKANKNWIIPSALIVVMGIVLLVAQNTPRTQTQNYTPSPSPATSIKTDIIGKWVDDVDDQYYIIFSEDGTFTEKSGDFQWATTGKYSISGNNLSLTKMMTTVCEVTISGKKMTITHENGGTTKLTKQ